MTVLADLLFTAVVFAAIVLLFTDYAEAVVAGTFFAVIWHIVALLGPSLLLATVLLALAVMLRTLALLVTDVEIGTPLVVQTLDDLLTPSPRRGDDEFARHFRRVDSDRSDADGRPSKQGRR